MSTRSTIARELPCGTIEAIYCHHDGEPEFNGRILLEHYSDHAKLDALMALGDISILAPEIGEQHSFTATQPGWCLAYGRDRGDRMMGKVYYKNLQELKEHAPLEDFTYLYRDGKWLVAADSGRKDSYTFQPLEEMVAAK